MPFEDLDTFHKGNAMPEATVSYEHATEKSRKAGRRPRLSVSIPTTICGTSKSKVHVLQVGSGEDLGKVRISGVEEGNKRAVLPSEHLHFFRWNFGYVPRLGETTFEGQRVPVEKISDEIFELTVPASWFES